MMQLNKIECWADELQRFLGELLFVYRSIEFSPIMIYSEVDILITVGLRYGILSQNFNLRTTGNEWKEILSKRTTIRII